MHIELDSFVLSAESDVVFADLVKVIIRIHYPEYRISVEFKWQYHSTWMHFTLSDTGLNDADIKNIKTFLLKERRFFAEPRATQVARAIRQKASELTNMQESVRTGFYNNN